MLKLKNNKLFKSIFSVTGVILLSKLLGFAKQMVAANVFGATIETDVIYLAEGFIGNIKYLLVQTVLTSFVAVYLNAQHKDEAHARGFAADLGKVLTVIAGSLALLVMLFAPQIAGIIAPSYVDEVRLQLAGYLRLFAPALMCFVWLSVSHGLLSANKRFIPGELEGLNQSVILIALVLLLGGRLGPQVLALAFVTYVLWNTVFMGLCSRRYWGKGEGNPFHNPHVRSLMKMAGPLLLGYSMVYVNETVGKILVSGLEAGTVTAMSYASVLSNLVATFVVSFCSILFPYITTHITKGEDRQAADMVSKSVLLLVMVFLPISVLTVICAEDIVTIVYGHGAFTRENVRIAAAALSGYAVMFAPLVLSELFSRFQYGYQNSKTPMINSTIGIGVNIALSLVLCPYYGVMGVAFASSMSTIICGVLNVITACRCNSFFRIKPLLKTVPWYVVGGCVCALAAFWSLKTFTINSVLIRFVVTVLCGGGAYLLTMSPLLYRILRKKKAAE
ncbi:MAG: hypothetical protein E7446_00970 [Ruminococcaceae bacterium]|nr:hypothetical protein [Oscillospiraceae bacterium]